MSDKTMDDIKSGKGLPPLSENDNSSSKPGIIMEQRADKGITYQIFENISQKIIKKNKKDD